VPGPQKVIRVTGARELRRQLKAFEGDLSDLRAVHQAAADRVLARAVRDAPHRTGRLAASLTAKGNNASAVVRSAGRKAPYAAPVHWGWPTRPNKGKRWRGGRIAANPFLYEAVVRFQAAIAADYLTAVDKLMGKIKGAG
jgi:phage gpG-like protein